MSFSISIWIEWMDPNIASIEDSYTGKSNSNMLVNYCWSLIRESPVFLIKGSSQVHI